MKKVLTLICMVLTAVLGVITLAACDGDGEGDKITVTYYFGNEQKAENVLNESELVEGLRLSVSHCEEVINANKDRYPILEHTNNILENQIY